MPSFDKHFRGMSTMDSARLETPSMVGYRIGMSSSGVIGRKLSTVFGVDAGLPREMDSAIRQLHTKLARVR